jgi:hypothetical protein
MSKKKFNKEALSIDYDDGEQQDDYDEFSNFLENHTERIKKNTASKILEMGEDFLNEIDHKKERKQKEKQPYIKYIIKKSNKYSQKYLLDLDFNDVVDIFYEIKNENKPFLKKFIEFLGF